MLRGAIWYPNCIYTGILITLLIFWVAWDICKALYVYSSLDLVLMATFFLQMQALAPQLRPRLH